MRKERAMSRLFLICSILFPKGQKSVFQREIPRSVARSVNSFSIPFGKSSVRRSYLKYTIGETEFLKLFFFPCHQRPPLVGRYGAWLSVCPAEFALHGSLDLAEAGGNGSGAGLRRLHPKIGGVLPGPVRQIGHNARLAVRRAQVPDLMVIQYLNYYFCQS